MVVGKPTRIEERWYLKLNQEGQLLFQCWQAQQRLVDELLEEYIVHLIDGVEVVAGGVVCGGLGHDG